MADKCKKGGAHTWVEVPVMGERFNETRFYCEKCNEIKIVRNPYEKPKRKFYLLSWKDWLRQADHTGSVKI
jgi:hypothetical protein